MIEATVNIDFIEPEHDIPYMVINPDGDVLLVSDPDDYATCIRKGKPESKNEVGESVDPNDGFHYFKGSVVLTNK